MLPPEGSVKDGRTIVYLERIDPSGGNKDQSGGSKKAGAAKPNDASASADAQKSPTPSGGKHATAPGSALDAKKKKSAPRAKPTVKPLLPSSQAAAAKNQAASMIAAAQSGAPFCEDCAEAHRLLEEASRLL